MSGEGLWIFGYGSLVWKPAFTHSVRVPGYIKGWKRRFWQGSTDHRGVPGKPGRVVTLLPYDIAFHHDEHCKLKGNSPDEYSVWGMCYWIEQKDVEAVLKYLDYREKGGYTRTHVEVTLHHDHPEYSDHIQFFACNSSIDGGSNPITNSDKSEVKLPSVVTALLYTANETNEEYLGPAPLPSIAKQIAESMGPSGHNAEYLFELGKSLKKLNVVDEHVESLVELVQAYLAETKSDQSSDTQ